MSQLLKKNSSVIIRYCVGSFCLHKPTGKKMLGYVFTDTAAILNLLDLRSIMGCPWAFAQYSRALFGQKENFNVYFSGKRRSLLHPNTAQRSFFPLQSFSRKLKEKVARKARVNTDASTSDRAHAPLGIP